MQKIRLVIYVDSQLLLALDSEARQLAVSRSSAAGMALKAGLPKLAGHAPRAGGGAAPGAPPARRPAAGSTALSPMQARLVQAQRLGVNFLQANPALDREALRSLLDSSLDVGGATGGEPLDLDAVLDTFDFPAASQSGDGVSELPDH